MSSPVSSPLPKKSGADEGISDDEEPKDVEDPGKVTMGNIQKLLQAELKPVKMSVDRLPGDLSTFKREVRKELGETGLRHTGVE